MNPHEFPAFCAPNPVSFLRRPRHIHRKHPFPAPSRRVFHPSSAPTRRPLLAALSIALTRESDKNSALRGALAKAIPRVECVELPCVRTVEGPDLGELSRALASRRWAWVVVTSPEAAAVFCAKWGEAGKPALQVAAVGAATKMALEAAGVAVRFVPGKATGKALVEEFEVATGETNAGGVDVLYPASLLAGSVVVEGLARKGFRVTRLNTYSTVEADWSEEEAARAREVDVVSFAAPSAVKSWVGKAGIVDGVAVACIGETSAAAAVSAGFPEANVFFPEKPGLGGWVSAVGNAIEGRE